MLSLILLQNQNWKHQLNKYCSIENNDYVESYSSKRMSNNVQQLRDGKE